MARKIKSNSSLLDELDKALYEDRWKDIEQTLKKIKKKHVIPESFSQFLLGVELIEVYLLGPAAQSQSQSTDAASIHPEKLLSEAKVKLRQCIDQCQPGHDASLEQLAKIKLGQLEWLCSEYHISLAALMETQSTADTSLLFTCKVLLEGHLYMGLCYEQLGKGSVSNNHSESFQAISAYEESLRLALSLIHSAKANSVQQHPAAFKAIETVLMRGTILALQVKSPVTAINLFRRVLQSKDDDVLQMARMISTTSLSSLLLFHFSPAMYIPPSTSSHSSAFSPSHLTEESILVSLLSKAVADSWDPSMTTPSHSPSTTFDLGVLALSNAGLPHETVHVMKDAMRFSCNLPHIWFQFALALISDKGYEQALAVYREAISLSPKDVLILCSAAKFCLEMVSQPDLCLKWAQMASEVDGNHFLRPRAEFLMGRSLSVLAEQEISSLKRGELHTRGLTHLMKATEMDQQNIEFAFHHALQKAETRNLASALVEVRRALDLDSSHTGCLHLLSLILSTQKRYNEALSVCTFALQKRPENFGLLECKAKLEVVSVNTHRALQTCKQALQLWQKLFASSDITGLIGKVTQDQLSLSDIPLSLYDKSTVKNDDFSLDMASDTGSSHFSLSAAQTPTNQPNLLQARIWCTIAEVFIKSEKISDASLCVREAQYLSPYLSSVLITHGRVLEMEGHLNQALKQYFNALSLQPGYPTALTLAGRLLHRMGRNVEAEKYLREATQVDQLNHEAWYWLAEVFVTQGESERAAGCFKTSLDLEASVPTQPFSAVLSSLQPPN